MKYLKVWTSFREVMEPLSDAEKGRLFDAMLVYAESFEEPVNLAGNERFVWPAAKQWIDLRILKACVFLRMAKRAADLKQHKPKKTNRNQAE